ncbi:hypothetical protein SBOR_8431 [Sclerotinia borealis F-4128]|uniref:Uncharacterized protein n=1 Tax=Sclerotinia borealis (strain F-4128) TaxID=1432307 RepID=W9C9C9_SCLBF|nr:hypothetical protein SBOR_8431 [Sclerotinia borealis F-4128]
MDSDADPPKLEAVKMLQIDNNQEFPALSPSFKPSTQKPLAAPSWGSLFASQISKTPRRIHHPLLSPLPVTPTKEASSHKTTPMREKENILPSPTAAECMSILSKETAETAVEEEEAQSESMPWDYSTVNTDSDNSVSKDENVDSEAIIVFPSFTAVNTPDPPQQEVLPLFKFPATVIEPEVNLYNDSPKLTKAKKVEIEELCEAERHDTPSYIRGGLPLRQVVANDPHRVIHAIKHMMHGIVYMRRALGAKQEEIDFLIDNHQNALNEIDILSENARLARLAIEKKQAAIKEARLAMEKKRAVATKAMECSKTATKFNPDAKPFAPSNFISSEFMIPATPFPLAPAIQIPSPLKYSTLHGPGFTVEQRRTPPSPYKFHPIRNRSRTWSMQRPSKPPNFNTYNQTPVSPIFNRQVPSPAPVILSQLPQVLHTNDEAGSLHEAVVRTPPQSPTPIPSRLDLSLADKTLLRTPVPGKTDHKSTPNSPTKQLSVNHPFKAISTNTSPEKRISNFRMTDPPQLYQPKANSSKILIPIVNTADDIQRAVFLIPRTHRHICPSSLITPDFKCPVPNCLLQQICPDFTSENGCSFRPPPLSDWPWNYPPRNPPSNQAQQCSHVHIPGTCLNSLAYFRAPVSSESESTSSNPPNPDPDPDPATSSHYCPILHCSTTRFHAWGCAKDWKTGFAVNGLTPAARSNNDSGYLNSSELSTEWRWRVAMEGLRVAHERGEYGCKGGSMPINAVFPRGHKGGDVRNWGPHTFSGKHKMRSAKTLAREKDRGRLIGAENGNGGGSGIGRSRGGSSDSRRMLARDNSTRSA